MESQRLGDYIVCNPTVKLKKGQQCQLTDIDSITIGQKYPISKGLVIYDGQSGSKFSKGDTIMARITPCLENGKIAMYNGEEDSIGSTELFVFRGKEGVSTNEFVYYFFKQDWIRNYAANSMTGASGRQRADIKFIQKAKVQFPPLSTQQKIASTLSAYDSHIENNQKRIKPPAQMAENLYNEWFVRFRFPGYENAEFEGGVPKGWNVSYLSDYGRIETGKTPSMEHPEYYGGKYLFIKTPDMHNEMYVLDTEESLSELGNRIQPKKLLPVNSIMVSCIGSAGVVAINAKPAHTNQQINSIVLKDSRNLEWLYFTCKFLKPTIELFGATGATMTNLSKGKFEKLKILEPSMSIREKYHIMSLPIFQTIRVLQENNKALIHQRDLLLPRLMSGKLSI